ncbi:DUF397 domain-containing protein [Asanoa sp. NPDC049518]|uniref:DUF397 domain-containing protein n=1 Tax=unclassified Asanoa TaxID=2685164 RepID=UPI0034295E19
MSDEAVTWTKSTYSGANGGCVEWAKLDSEIGVRDSKDKTGPVLTFTRTAWQSFVDATSRGDYRPDT